LRWLWWSLGGASAPRFSRPHPPVGWAKADGMSRQPPGSASGFLRIVARLHPTRPSPAARAGAAGSDPDEDGRTPIPSSPPSLTHYPEPGFILAIIGFWRYPCLTYMAKALTKLQIAASLAETVGLTKKQAVETLEALVALAYKNAKNSFTIPGLGKIVLVDRKARMGRNPATGETIKIAAKRVVKFRVAKAAKDAILGAKK